MRYIDNNASYSYGWVKLQNVEHITYLNPTVLFSTNTKYFGSFSEFESANMSTCLVTYTVKNIQQGHLSTPDDVMIVKGGLFNC